SRQLAAQLPAGLHIQRAVDRLVTDAHERIIRILHAQPGRDLLRRPAPLKTLLDHRQQPRTPGRLGWLRPRRQPLGEPLGPQRPIPPTATAATDLTTDRRAMAPEPPRDHAVAVAATDPDEDLFALDERQSMRRVPHPPARQRIRVTD